ncbi:MAG: recombination protein RecR [Deltaproteobacteria bacterium]|nr:recombination protein RecR [Deltaproteobacteria bacterium]
MDYFPAPLKRLIKELSRLPGVGSKSATRMALYILNSRRELADSLAKSLVEVKDQIKFCSVCFNFTDTDPCAVCNDAGRSGNIICVVEGPGDQLAIEETGVFKGKYHVLHGVLSPLDGIGPENLKIAALLNRCNSQEIEEVVLAINPTAQGEATSSYLADILLRKNIKVTRIALGVPVGGDLKYMDYMTLRHSFSSRTPVQQ